MNKVIAFSLWGDDPKYCVGAVKNAELAETIYPGWQCRFYVGQSTPEPTIQELYHRENVDVVWMDEPGDWSGMFWRFLPAGEDDVDVFLSRDCDSRLSLREAEAVEDWLQGPFGVHVMRDHPYHTAVILGGMWGAKKGVIPDMAALINSHLAAKRHSDYWQVDQEFLRDVIYPRVRSRMQVHDEFRGQNAFPSPRRGYEFVGQIFDENDQTVAEHVEILRQAIG